MCSAGDGAVGGSLQYTGSSCTSGGKLSVYDSNDCTGNFNTIDVPAGESVQPCTPYSPGEAGFHEMVCSGGPALPTPAPPTPAPTPAPTPITVTNVMTGFTKDTFSAEYQLAFRTATATTLNLATAEVTLGPVTNVAAGSAYEVVSNYFSQSADCTGTIQPEIILAGKCSIDENDASMPTGTQSFMLSGSCDVPAIQTFSDASCSNAMGPPGPRAADSFDVCHDRTQDGVPSSDQITLTCLSVAFDTIITLTKADTDAAPTLYAAVESRVTVMAAEPTALIAAFTAEQQKEGVTAIVTPTITSARELYKCVVGQCKLVPGGVAKSTCSAACHPSPAPASGLPLGLGLGLGLPVVAAIVMLSLRKRSGAPAGAGPHVELAVVAITNCKRCNAPLNPTGAPRYCADCLQSL